jgi:uncharacterized protein
MPGTYFHHLFSKHARRLQRLAGSREIYARREEAAGGEPDTLTDRETVFIAGRDSFYMASVTDTGWPYVQHRGGPAGFVKCLGSNRLGFADYGGNRQYVSTGNLLADGRVSLFFMDYAARRRLKLIGHATIEELDKFPELTRGDPVQQGERAVLIDVVGFDWNCPKFITPRFSPEEIEREREAAILLKGDQND